MAKSSDDFNDLEDQSKEAIDRRFRDSEWRVVVRPTGGLFLGYEVRLEQDDTGMVYGPEGYSWASCFTLAGAVRKGNRYLRHLNRQHERERRRQVGL